MILCRPILSKPARTTAVAASVMRPCPMQRGREPVAELGAVDAPRADLEQHRLEADRADGLALVLDRPRPRPGCRRASGSRTRTTRASAACPGAPPSSSASGTRDPTRSARCRRRRCHGTAGAAAAPSRTRDRAGPSRGSSSAVARAAWVATLAHHRSRWKTTLPLCARQRSCVTPAPLQRGARTVELRRHRRVAARIRCARRRARRPPRRSTTAAAAARTRSRSLATIAGFGARPAPAAARTVGAGAVGSVGGATVGAGARAVAVRRDRRARPAAAHEAEVDDHRGDDDDRHDDRERPGTTDRAPTVPPSRRDCVVEPNGSFARHLGHLR